MPFNYKTPFQWQTREQVAARQAAAQAKRDEEERARLQQTVQRAQEASFDRQQREFQAQEAEAFTQEATPIVNSWLQKREGAQFAKEAQEIARPIIQRTRQNEAEAFARDVAPTINRIQSGGQYAQEFEEQAPPAIETGGGDRLGRLANVASLALKPLPGFSPAGDPSLENAPPEVRQRFQDFTQGGRLGFVDRAVEPITSELEEQADRVLRPAATTPIGLGLSAAFPAATAVGLPASYVAGLTGHGLEGAGVPVAQLPVLGGVGPRGVGEIVGGMRNGPRRAGTVAGLADDIDINKPLANAVEETADDVVRAEDDLVRQFEELAPRSEQAWAQQMDNWRQVRSERTANFAARRDELRAQGVPADEAIEQATSELRGRMPILQGAFGVDMAPAQEAIFWDRALSNLKEFEQVNMARALKEVADNERNFKPHEWDLIEKVMGRSFREAAETSAARRPPPVNRARRIDILAAPEPNPNRLPSMFDLDTNPVPSSLDAKTPTLPGINAPANKAEDVLPKPHTSLFDIMADSLGLPRAIMSSMDGSVGRQLSKTVARHPLLTKESMQSMLNAMRPRTGQAYAERRIAELASEGVGNTPGYIQVIKGADGATRDIPLGQLLENHYMAVPGTPAYETSGLMAKPEFFVSRLASKLPGTRQSGRGFATGWNEQMQGVNRYWLSKFTKMNGGALTDVQVKKILDTTDRLLGKGNVGGQGNWISDTLRALGFAPGYRLSGPQAFTRLLFGNKETRRMAAENLLTWVGLGNSIMTLAKLGAGATVVTSLGSTQFGRIQFPGSDTYYNIWGTDNVLARTIIQAVKREKIDTQGNITHLGNGEGNLSGFLTSAKDIASEYLRSGQDPIVGLLADLEAGETYLGEPLKWDAESAWKVARERLPMIGNELWDINATDGPLQSILSAPGAFFGAVSTTSYTPTAERFKAIPTFNSASIDVTRKYIPNAPEPLNLTANEERDLRDFIGKDGPVMDWKNEAEKTSAAPEGVKHEDIIRYVADQEGLSPRLREGAVFIYKAAGDEAAYNLDWIKYGLQHESELADRFPGTFNTKVMDTYRDRAREAGLID